MNKKPSITYFILIIASFFHSCSGPAKVKEENINKASSGTVSLHTGGEENFTIDTKETIVTWKGSSPMGAHTGYVSVSKGELVIENGELTGGAVEVDMNTIVGDDHRSDNNLINHLKDPDFFDVKKFPFSSIVITSVASINGEDKEITGNLTIKGITHPVTFPAKIQVINGTAIGSCKLVIDRTQWDVRYKSGKFFDNLKNEVISDSIEFNIKFTAKFS